MLKVLLQRHVLWVAVLRENIRQLNKEDVHLEVVPEEVVSRVGKQAHR